MFMDTINTIEKIEENAGVLYSENEDEAIKELKDCLRDELPDEDE